MSTTDTKKSIDRMPTEEKHLLIYGFSKDDLKNVLRHFETHLPEYIKLKTEHANLVTRLTLKGSSDGAELLRFKMNQYAQNLQLLFQEEIVTTDNKNISQVLGELLAERELTVSCAESCTGGNIAHKITQNSGSSSYFLGSVVSYSNEVKAKVLDVSRGTLGRYGAVSREVAEQMVRGVSKLMRTDCAMATTGIAGPDGGTKYKPVGTVWIAAKYGDKVASELIQFSGDRNTVIESATNHAMVMLIKMLRNNYKEQEEINDD